LVTAAKAAFTDGLAIAAGVGSALLLASAVAVWMLLKPLAVAAVVLPVGRGGPSPLRARK
jgi:DHA2 family multidrug resistance protein-like MFS transporter